MFLCSLPTSTYLTLTSSQNNVNKGGERVPGESLWDMEWALKNTKEQKIVVLSLIKGRLLKFFPNICASDEGLEDADIGSKQFVLNSN